MAISKEMRAKCLTGLSQSNRFIFVLDLKAIMYARFKVMHCHDKLWLGLL